MKFELCLILFPLALSAILGKASQTIEPTTAETANLHRLYKESKHDHFYTTDEEESATAQSHSDYQYEGIIGRVYTTQVPGTKPLFRLYHNDQYDHLYTLSEAEVESAEKLGYVYEHVEGYIFEENSPGLLPLIRLYSPSVQDHLYTVSYEEAVRTHLFSGFTLEGITGYLLAN